MRDEADNAGRTRSDYRRFHEGTWEHYLIEGYIHGLDWFPGLKRPHKFTQLHVCQRDTDGNLRKPELKRGFVKQLDQCHRVEWEVVEEAMEQLQRARPELHDVLLWYQQPVKLMDRTRMAAEGVKGKEGMDPSTLSKMLDTAMQCLWFLLPIKLRRKLATPDVAEAKAWVEAAE